MTQFRRMGDADLPRVAENELRAYAFPWSERNFADCLREGCDCWVLVLDGELCGHGVVTSGAGEAHLMNICIRRDRQGEGLGRQLLAHLLLCAFDRGARRLFLEVRPSNHVALALYRSAGFAQIGVRKDYYAADRGREDALVLALDLGDYFSVQTGTD